MRILVIGLAVLCLQISAATAPSMARVDETGRINLGFREAEPPMSFINKNGAVVGYSIDLCDHIAAAVKKKLDRADIAVSYVPVTAETRFDAIESGKIDILCGATTKSPN
jgi:glutamate/aspartate transport system substrate-binding protein